MPIRMKLRKLILNTEMLQKFQNVKKDADFIFIYSYHSFIIKQHFQKALYNYSRFVNIININ